MSDELFTLEPGTRLVVTRTLTVRYVRAPNLGETITSLERRERDLVVDEAQLNRWITARGGVEFKTDLSIVVYDGPGGPDLV